MSEQPPGDWPVEDVVVPAKQTGPWFWGCLLFFFATVIFISIFVPILAQDRISKQTELCVANLRQIAAACDQYASDNDGRLPADKWMDNVLKYNVDEVQLACPVQRRVDPQTFGYSLAKEVAGQRLSEIGAKSVMVFDSKQIHRNSVAPRADTPNPGRHNNGHTNVVALADGSVRPDPVK